MQHQLYLYVFYLSKKCFIYIITEISFMGRSIRPLKTTCAEQDMKKYYFKGLHKEDHS